VKLHPDARSEVARRFRALGLKLPGPYIEQSLDRLEALLPLIAVGQETVIKRDEIAKVMKEPSFSIISRLLHHLRKSQLCYVRFAGRNGVGITLRIELTKSPWASRRKPTETLKVFAKAREGNRKTDALAQEVEVDPMPVDEQGDTSLNLDTMLAALNQVARSLNNADLKLGALHALTGPAAANAYAAKEQIQRAMGQVSKIRAAVVSGTNADLETLLKETKSGTPG